MESERYSVDTMKPFLGDKNEENMAHMAAAESAMNFNSVAERTSR